jgi:hypothetical protein
MLVRETRVRKAAAVMRVCPLCTHERRDEIESALRNNEPVQQIARRHGTSLLALLTHRGHLDHSGDRPGLAAQAPAAAGHAAAPIADQIKSHQEQCLRLLDVAEGASEVRTVFASLREMRPHLMALGDLAYELTRPR